MATYYFERDTGTLNAGRVREIIVQAGKDTGSPSDYNPENYAYSEEGSKKVTAKGPETMKVNKLEKAATELGFKTTSVTVVEGLDADRHPLAASAEALAATDYGVQITMDQATVTALASGNYSLYGFKAVQTTVGGGMPLVWFKSTSYGLTTDVNWQIQFEAYTSQSQIIPGGQITGLNSYPATLGQQLVVDSPQGTGTIQQGTPGNIAVMNQTSNPFTCGISEVVNGTAEPLCAFPLYGNGLDAMVPIEKVMLTFATKQVNTGTVIERAYSQSILVDLTSATQRAVSFDINKGWSWGGYGWGQAIPANQNVVPILIEDGASYRSGARTLLG